MSTWITRIVINESLGRMRKQQRRNVVIPFADPHQDHRPHSSHGHHDFADGGETVAGGDQWSTRPKLLRNAGFSGAGICGGAPTA